MMNSVTRVVLALASVSILAACGSNGDESIDLSPAALEGRGIVRSKGCASCHGSNGGGGVGPAFVGLAGAEVVLEDGDVVVADRDYLVESMTDPQAKIVEGYRLPMPQNELTAEEIDAIVVYIEALAEVEP
ncbi:c-type cytochrome [Ilumatobacter sp.]|uniref:c-type cytochrome n=1 Tax=Ilumatobacter sp. TaxID=1967498 RepID=UPI003AF9442F